MTVKHVCTCLLSTKVLRYDVPALLATTLILTVISFMQLIYKSAHESNIFSPNFHFLESGLFCTQNSDVTGGSYSPASSLVDCKHGVCVAGGVHSRCSVSMVT